VKVITPGRIVALLAGAHADAAAGAHRMASASALATDTSFNDTFIWYSSSIERATRGATPARARHPGTLEGSYPA
jgi:hypothetical protein